MIHNSPKKELVVVDPSTGLPITTIGGRLAVDAAINAETVNVDTRDLDATQDNIQIVDPITAAGLKIETDGSVNVNIVATGFGGTPDSILSTGSEDGTTTGTRHVVKVDANGAQAVNSTLSAETTKVIGTVNVAASATATCTNVVSSATNVTLLSSNTARKGAVFYNDSTQICYLKFGATATSSSFTIPMAAASLITMGNDPVYTGVVDGIWVTANGNMRVTELT